MVFIYFFLIQYLLTMGSVFQFEKVPLTYTCFPPPSHLNTVGRTFFLFTLDPSDTVADLCRGSI